MLMFGFTDIVCFTKKKIAMLFLRRFFIVGGTTWSDQHLHVANIDVSQMIFNISAETYPPFGMHNGDRYIMH